MVQEEGISRCDKPDRRTGYSTYEDKEKEIWIVHGSFTVSAKAGHVTDASVDYNNDGSKKRRWEVQD
jgi:hypothetical protein